MNAKQDRLTAEQFRFIVRHAPLVSIDLVIADAQGHVLLGLRNNRPAQGTWFVPGGIIFKGEKLDDAFTRILRAETGLALPRSQARPLGVFEHFYDENRYGEPGYGTHYVVNAYRLELRERPAIAADEQHRALQWRAPADIRAAPDVHPNTRAYFA
jgi:colanic acid biosynthesis protein WcaH